MNGVELNTFILTIHVLHWVVGISFFILSGYCFYYRRLTASLPLGSLALSAGWWAILAGLIFIVPSFELKVMLNRFKMVGVSFIPFCCLWFAVSIYWPMLVKKRLIIIFAIVPLIFSILVLTPYHHLMITNYDLITIGDQVLLTFADGAWFKFHYLYSNVLIVLCITAIIASRDEPGIKRKVSRVALCFAFLFPMFIDLISVNLIHLVRFIQLAPASLFLTAMMLARSIFKEHVLDLIPFARGIVVDELPDMHLIFNSLGDLVDFNRSAEEKFKLTRKDLGRNKEELMKDHLFLGLSAIDLDRHFYQRSEILLKDQKGHMIGSTIVFKDVTLQEQLNQELRDVNMVKTQLLGVLGHDLQSHLSSLSLLSEGMVKSLDQYGHEDLQVQIEYIHHSTRSSIEFVDQLLTWTKSHLGSLTVRKIQLDFNQLTEEILRFLGPIAFEKEIDFDIQIEEGAFLSADPQMLKIVLRNLISNAIRHTKKNGYIVVKLKSESDFSKIDVVDFGDGMNEDQLRRVLGARLEEGQGFGLFVSRELVRRMKGTLWASSSPGNGSTFSVKLPH
jgi:signal transduction histidine kinase